MPLAATEHALTRDFADEVYEFLVSVDLSRWQDDARAQVDASLRELQGKAEALRERWSLPVLPGSPEELLRHAVEQVVEGLPDPNALADATIDEWEHFEQRVADQLSPLYEAMATRLKDCGAKARHLRPDNYWRALFHSGAGLAGALGYQFLFSEQRHAWLVIGAWLVFSWSLEISRRFSVGVNDFLMRSLRLIAREHERYRVNSATWFGTAAAILLLTTPGYPGVLGLVALSVGDPAAAIIGRRFGRTRLRSGRSLEGTLAFVVAALLLAVPWVVFLRPEIALLPGLVATLGAVVVGAVVELFADRVDDNLAIPVSTAWTAALILALFG
ncbi:MAG: hypothetical protein JXX28_13030 [Deltaproteobacteria bacterium]|nr:hypothetical protein [Deltaproteobacteria bacterium]